MSACLAAFHFLRPWWLLLLLPLAWLGWRLYRAVPGGGLWSRILDPVLLPHVLVDRAANRRRRRLLPFALGAMLGIVALAGPTCERLPVPLFRDDAALVVLLDLSTSMLTEDIAPNRLARARFEIRDLLTTRRGGQTALVVFAAQPFTVTPLTDDSATIDAQLAALTPSLMPRQGSAPSRAIERGRALLQQADFETGDLLLVTDGLSDAALTAAEAALKGSPYRLSVLAVGTADGAPIPNESGGFIADAKGGIVIAKLEAKNLRTLAQAGHGLYVPLDTGDADTRQLVGLLAAPRTRDTAREIDVLANQWREIGPYLLLPLLALAALAFRRGVLLALPLALLAHPPAADAGWWLTPDQAGRRAFENGDYAAAAREFERRDWQATARYRAGDYAGALAALGAPHSAADHYNRGNALARLGRYDEAIAAYDQVLAANAAHADARYNKELLERLQQEQRQQQSTSDQQQSPEEDRQSGQGKGQDERAASGAGQQEEAQATGRDERLQQSPGERQGKREPDADRSHSQRAEGNGQGEASAGTEADEDEARTDEAKGQAPGRQEESLATEQWLRQIPDDPGGLWRRKFQYQYGRMYGDEAPSDEPW